jgi:hypothetical protein
MQSVERDFDALQLGTDGQRAQNLSPAIAAGAFPFFRRDLVESVRIAIFGVNANAKKLVDVLAIQLLLVSLNVLPEGCRAGGERQ